MNTTITPRTAVADLVGSWVEQLRAEQRLARTTIDEYERVLRNLVIPKLGALSISEVVTGRINEVLLELGEQSLNRQRKAKVVFGHDARRRRRGRSSHRQSGPGLAEHQPARA
jgi:hypothetical protein